MNEVDPIYFDKSYYVNPAGADKAFLVLLSAMEKQKKAGIAKTVLGTKETVILIRADHGNMIVNTLFFYDEVQAAPAYKKAAITKQELELAKTLINQMSGKFEPENYKDEYSEKVRRAIKSKISGNKIITSRDEPAPAKVINIMEALKKSLKENKTTKTPSKSKKAAN